MKAVQRFAAVTSILLLFSTSVVTAPQIARAETASETSEAPADTAPSQNDVNLESNSEGETNNEEAPAGTDDDQGQSTPLGDGWHGGSGGPLWYQQNGKKVTDRWLLSGSSWFYLSSDGTAFTGVHEIEGSLYCFADDGQMQTGWTHYDGTWYHASPSGKLDTGWLYTGGAWYLLDQDGAMETGIQSSGGSSYLLQSSGAMATGWGIDPASGSWCYADSSGRLKTGWQFINNGWYLIGSDCHMLKGIQRQDNIVYCLRDSGVMATGWAWDSASQSWYYASASGALLSGWQWINGLWYWLDLESKAMQSGWLDLNGARYHLSDSGTMDTGWLHDGDSWYWLNLSSGSMSTGWQRVNGTWYYLDPTEGKMRTGLLDTGNNKYYLKASGALASGWVYDADESCWYLASSDPSDGHLLTGWQKVGSAWYYLRPDNDRLFTGWFQEGDNLYYFKPSGAMATNEWIDYIDGAKLYMSADGYAAFEMRDGLVYKNRNSNELAEGWVGNGDSWLYVNNDGTIATGWLRLGGTWYYLDPTTGIMQTGWVKVDSAWYWLSPSGAMATGWTTIGSTRWQLDDYTGALHEPEQAPTTDAQRRIVEAAQATPSPGRNLCAMWVSQVFSRAGLGYPEGNACDMFWQWCNRSDLRDLKVGMIVAVPSHTHTYMGGIYGHVCIYIGGGMVMDNTGYVRTMSLNEWLAHYTTTYSPRWGWCNDLPLA